MAQYYLEKDNDSVGPFSVGELLSHGLTPVSQVWSSETEKWEKATDIPEVAQLFFGPDYTGPHGVMSPVSQLQQSSKVESNRYLNDKGEWPRMNMLDSVVECLRKYADFKGRARRSEFWWFQLFNVLVGVFTFGYGSALTVIPTMAVTVRRLHDSDRSGWWYFAYLIPVVLVSAFLFLIEPGYYAGTYSIFGTPLYDMTESKLTAIKMFSLVIIGLMSLVLVIFLCADSDLEANKYGISSKHQSPGYIPPMYEKKIKKQEARQLRSDKSFAARGERPMLDFLESIEVCMTKWFDFTGRARRSEFWWFQLGAIVLIALSLFVYWMSAIMLVFNESFRALQSVYFVVMYPVLVVLVLVILIANIGSGIRRLHDTNRSGWWLVGFLIIRFILQIAPVIGLITRNYETVDFFGIEMQPGTFVIVGMSILVASLMYYVYLIYLLCIDSDKKENKYGSSPKYQ